MLHNMISTYIILVRTNVYSISECTSARINICCNILFNIYFNLIKIFEKKKQTGSGQPVNGAIPSLPSPTMPTFNMAAQTPNGQPGGTEAVYTNGIPQTYPGRESL